MPQSDSARADGLMHELTLANRRVIELEKALYDIKRKRNDVMRCVYNPHTVECTRIGEYKLIETDTGKEYYCCSEHVQGYKDLNTRYGPEVFVICGPTAPRLTGQMRHEE